MQFQFYVLEFKSISLFRVYVSLHMILTMDSCKTNE
jgi:hypothetical protein